MLLLVAVLALSVGIGWLAGGRLDGLADMRLRWWPLAVAALAIQFINPPQSRAMLIALIFLSFGMLVVVGVRNIRSPGFPLILAGLLMNLLVIGLNGGMPVSVAAAEASGQPEAAAELRAGDTDMKHVRSDDATLAILSDVIPVPPPFAQVVSVGDIVFYAGIGRFIVAAMRRSRKPQAEESELPLEEG